MAGAVMAVSLKMNDIRKVFLKGWFLHFASDAFLAMFITVWFAAIIPRWVWIFLACIVAMIAAYQASFDTNKEFKKKFEESLAQLYQAQKETKLWKETLIEKSAGFPTLLQAIEQYDKIKDEEIEKYLRNKSHPSKKGAEVVREEAQRRRRAEYENKQTKSIIEYYESIAPFLVDFKNDITGLDYEEKYRDYDEEERLDPTTNYGSSPQFVGKQGES